MNEIFKITEVIKYTRYDKDTALVILSNDVLNLHLRTASIGSLSLINNPNNVTVNIVTQLNEDIVNDGGRYYTGEISVTYEKLDAVKVYPTGFLVSKWMGLESILATLAENTRVVISKTECSIVEEAGIFYIQFNEDSLFWKGRIMISSEYIPLATRQTVLDPDPTLDDVLDKGVLSGFNTKVYLDVILDKPVLSGFNNKKPIGHYFKTNELSGFNTKDKLRYYLTSELLEGFNNKKPVDWVLTKEELDGFN